MHTQEVGEDQGAMPRYQRLKAHISGQIAAGRLRPGQRIPSELELARSFGFSRMTVSRALNELETQGEIIRVQGVGSFVSTPKTESAVLEIRDVAAEIAQRGQTYSCTPLHVGRAGGKAVNALLGLPPTAVHYRTKLLHHADGVAVQIEDRRVNPAFAPAYIDQDFTQRTPYQHLMAIAPLQAAEHAFAAELASEEDARALHIARDSPCIVLRRRTWSLDMVASYAVLIAPSSRHRYAGVFGTLPPSARWAPRL